MQHPIGPGALGRTGFDIWAAFPLRQHGAQPHGCRVVSSTASAPVRSSASGHVPDFAWHQEFVLMRARARRHVAACNKPSRRLAIQFSFRCGRPGSGQQPAGCGICPLCVYYAAQASPGSTAKLQIASARKYLSIPHERQRYSSVWECPS